MKIKISNFQSIEYCELEIPKNSFTCIVGPSNIGKSAIRRALCCLLYNTSDASYIRTGAKECSVEVIFESGTKVRWFRNDNNAGCYDITGYPLFNKLNKTVPKPILDEGFRELVLSKDKVNVQIASQFSNIFLLNDSGSKITEVFSNLGNLNKIIAANRSCSSDLKSDKSKISIRKDDLILIKEKINGFKDLDKNLDFVGTIRNSFESLKKISELKDKAKNFYTALISSVEKVKILKPVNSITLDPFDIDLNKFFKIKELLKKYEKVSLNLSYYSNINKKEIETTLGSEYDLFLKLVKLSSSYNRAVNRLAQYSKVKEVTEFNIDTEKVIKLKSMLDRVFKSKEAILDLRENIKKADIELSLFEKEKIEIHKTLKVCPLCDNKGFSCV